MKNLYYGIYYGIVGLVCYAKQAKEQKAMINPSKDNLIDVITIDDKEISVHYMPSINKMGIVYGAMVHNAFTKKEYICVDDYYYTLPDDARYVVLYHELGHSILGHYANFGIKEVWDQCVMLGKIALANDEEKNLLLESVVSQRDYSKETEADEYAIKHCGTQAVLAFLQTCYTLVPSIEIAERYKYIAGVEINANVFAALKSKLDNATTISIDTLEE